MKINELGNVEKKEVCIDTEHSLNGIKILVFKNMVFKCI